MSHIKDKQDLQVTAKKFMEYLSKIGGTLPEINITESQVYSQMSKTAKVDSGSFFMHPVTPHEISTIVKNLKNKTTKDSYDFSTVILNN